MHRNQKRYGKYVPSPEPKLKFAANDLALHHKRNVNNAIPTTKPTN